MCTNLNLVSATILALSPLECKKKGTGDLKSPAHQRGCTYHYFPSWLAALDQKLPTQSISSHSLSFLVILGHSWSFHVMEQAPGVSWGHG